MDYIITPNETEKLLSRAFAIGFQRGLETAGAAPQYVSQNAAFKRYGKGRVLGWVESGQLIRKPSGGGKTSTVFYEAARLQQLDAANCIVIRKARSTDEKF